MLVAKDADTERAGEALQRIKGKKTQKMELKEEESKGVGLEH